MLRSRQKIVYWQVISDLWSWLGLCFCWHAIISGSERWSHRSPTEQRVDPARLSLSLPAGWLMQAGQLSAGIRPVGGSSWDATQQRVFHSCFLNYLVIFTLMNTSARHADLSLLTSHIYMLTSALLTKKKWKKSHPYFHIQYIPFNHYETPHRPVL